MPQIPITLTGNINIIITCSDCQALLEATIIVATEQNQIIITLDSKHNCNKTKKIPLTILN